MELGGDGDARAGRLDNLLATLPMVVVLSAATVALFACPLRINAIIGLIGSIGVSVDVAIIILSGLRQDGRAAGGNRATTVAAMSRHIRSSTATTCGGVQPLILAGGSSWWPFARSIASGVMLSTAVTVVVVPPAFAPVAPCPALGRAVTGAPAGSGRPAAPVAAASAQDGPGAATRARRPVPATCPGLIPTGRFNPR